MRVKNRLLALLEKQQIPLGIQLFTGSAALVEVLGQTGFDFVMIDTEHSATNVRALEDLIRTAELAGVIPYVRVPDLHDEVGVRRALEAGAEGLFLPLVQSVDDIDRVADFAFMPPKGRRGICPSIRAANYDVAHFEAYTAWNNTEVALVPMIETEQAVANIDSICAHPDVRMLVFAAGDLSMQMHQGMQGLRSPLVQAAYRKVLDAARQHDVAVIGGPIVNPTAEACRKSLEEGVRIFCLGLDTLGFRRFCEATNAALKAGLEGSAFNRPPLPASGF